MIIEFGNQNKFCNNLWIHFQERFLWYIRDISSACDNILSTRCDPWDQVGKNNVIEYQ